MSNSPRILAEPGNTIHPRSASTLLHSKNRRLAALASTLWAAYRDYQSWRATERMLQELDDRTLKDIGLTRSEIEFAEFGKSVDRVRPKGLHWRKQARPCRPFDR
jgi:uncharacterized protein YjiS (DUF1127 family)